MEMIDINHIARKVKARVDAGERFSDAQLAEFFASEKTKLLSENSRPSRKAPRMSRAEKAFTLLVAAKHDCETEDYESAIASATEAVDLMTKILEKRK